MPGTSSRFASKYCFILTFVCTGKLSSKTPIRAFFCDCLLQADAICSNRNFKQDMALQPKPKARSSDASMQINQAGAQCNIATLKYDAWAP
jgi:hypothetical protein